MHLHIESLATNGKGVATIEKEGYKRAVFITGGVPGDVVEAKITKQKKIYYEAEIETIITPSPHRKKPECTHFSTCGACNYLHITYKKQLAEKKKQLQHYLQRNDLKAEVHVIGAPKPLGYRDRLRVQAQEGKIGFYAKKSNEVVAIKHCDIIREELNEVFKSTLKEGEHRYAYDYASGEVKKADEECNYEVEGLQLAFQPDGFVQNNLELNKELVRIVVEEAQGENILDLYAGNGNLSIPLAQKAQSVIAVEGDKGGFALLQKNIAANNVQNVEAIKADANDYPAKGYDTVVVDPPRAGAENLERIDAKVIIYVSCNPQQMVKEIKKLKQYELKKTYLIDMFAQTTHFETVAVLEKKKINS